MRFPFTRIEARLQALIEGSAARLFPWTQPRADLTSRLVLAMQSNTRQSGDGTLWAPSIFTLQLSPEGAAEVRENWALLEELAQMLMQAGSEGGLRFASPPIVRAVAVDGLLADEVNILAEANPSDMEDTSTLAHNLPGAAVLPPNAFLIVNGQQTVPLNSALINLGRGKKNDLVIDDLRVSRAHAQLRAIHGRYLLFDLQSTGGTFVNGERVTEALLRPGDVISLAGVPLIYGQDPSGSPDDTQQYVSPDEDDL